VVDAVRGHCVDEPGDVAPDTDDDYDNRHEAQLAVACSETRNPHDPARVENGGDRRARPNLE
jgi:hypothetical protein